MSENERFDEATPVIRRAIALLDATFEALADPARWCKGAYARDAAGKPIGGSIVAAVESKRATSRCVFGELLHQGLQRGYRIEIATLPGWGEQTAAEVTRAPANWMLAGAALSLVALSTIEEETRQLGAAEPKADSKPPSGARRVGQFVLTSIGVNDRGNYEDAIWSVVLAAEVLRAELDSLKATKP